jgi:hypothetical protein
VSLAFLARAVRAARLRHRLSRNLGSAPAVAR